MNYKVDGPKVGGDRFTQLFLVVLSSRFWTERNTIAVMEEVGSAKRMTHGPAQKVGGIDVKPSHLPSGRVDVHINVAMADDCGFWGGIIPADALGASCTY